MLTLLCEVNNQSTKALTHHHKISISTSINDDHIQHKKQSSHLKRENLQQFDDSKMTAATFIT